MVTPDEAALARRLSPRAVYQLVETGHIHFVESSEGTLMICLDSLLANAKGESLW